MKKLAVKDYKLRKNYVKTFTLCFPYKIIYKNQILSKKVKYFAFLKFIKLSNYNFLSKKKNVCIYTYRARGIYTKLRLSRLEFKRKVNTGLLPNWYKIK